MVMSYNRRSPTFSNFFFFNDTATTEIYTLSLHDALPIFWFQTLSDSGGIVLQAKNAQVSFKTIEILRSEEHTSELQSQSNLVCRLLLEKKKHEPRAAKHYHRSRDITPEPLSFAPYDHLL